MEGAELRSAPNNFNFVSCFKFKKEAAHKPGSVFR